MKVLKMNTHCIDYGSCRSLRILSLVTKVKLFYSLFLLSTLIMNHFYFLLSTFTRERSFTATSNLKTFFLGNIVKSNWEISELPELWMGLQIMQGLQ